MLNICNFHIHLDIIAWDLHEQYTDELFGVFFVVGKKEIIAFHLRFKRFIVYEQSASRANNNALTI